jgi:hypothetical protein
LARGVNSRKLLRPDLDGPAEQLSLAKVLEDPHARGDSQRERLEPFERRSRGAIGGVCIGVLVSAPRSRLTRLALSHEPLEVKVGESRHRTPV